MFGSLEVRPLHSLMEASASEAQGRRRRRGLEEAMGRVTNRNARSVRLDPLHHSG